MTDLTTIKNEIRYINSLQEGDGYKIPEEYKERLKYLFKRDRETESKLLLLESAFSMIEQMWLKEISNAEIRKRRWFEGCGCDSCCGYYPLQQPEKINPLLESLMDPINCGINSCNSFNLDNIDHHKLKLFNRKHNKKGIKNSVIRNEHIDIESGESYDNVKLNKRKNSR